MSVAILDIGAGGVIILMEPGEILSHYERIRALRATDGRDVTATSRVMDRTYAAAARELVAAGRRLHARGWVLGTSGNFSAVVTRRPITLAITASSVDKGALRAADILRIDAGGEPLGRRTPTPSAETKLHLEIVRSRGAGAVLHTHSVWGTMLSDVHGDAGALEIRGYEMLKGLAGVTTHAHTERVPIVENDQDMDRLARRVSRVLKDAPGAHAVLLRRHGLYTWGSSVADAVRHVEILEFLFETVGRTAAYTEREVHHGTAENP
jgi:methylthioribulose-1-phosphate dehydratase